MFLKSLIISDKVGVVREIYFRKGINLIIDETPNLIDTTSGNDVGKTTVLKLIDFCFGAKAEIIYANPENKKENYELVKKYLIENEVLITLTLIDNFDSQNSTVIERNFLTRSKNSRKINGQNFGNDEDYELALSKVLFPKHHINKPSLRQIISHNIRYEDESLTNTLKTLDKYTSDVEYETLYLFLFGCEFHEGDEKQEISKKLQQELTFKSRLEKKQNKAAYETTLELINNDIDMLNKRKANLNINENFEAELTKLNQVNYEINVVSSEITKLNIRKDLIKEAEQDISATFSTIDLQQLHLIYQQVTQQIQTIQKTFDDLVSFHNQMVSEKVKFITKELPTLEQKLTEKGSILKSLLKSKRAITDTISKSNSFEELEEIVTELNIKYQQKGECEGIIQQISEVENNITLYESKLKEIEDNLFSNDFEMTVKKQVGKFNKFFADISNQLYGERYQINHTQIEHKKTKQKTYKFTVFNPFNPNIASGKKQGEIASFEIAYVLFSQEENIPHLNFILNDKKELMHDNQIVKIAQLVHEQDIQFVVAILKDKLPEELNKEEYFILKLSHNDKLFKIENR